MLLKFGSVKEFSLSEQNEKHADLHWVNSSEIMS